jgi:hypothetical protein
MMWTHYGNQHRGVCFVFDREKFDAAVKAKYGGDAFNDKITYMTLSAPPAWTPILDATDVHTHGEVAAAARFFAQYKRDILFTKNRYWCRARVARNNRQPPTHNDCQHRSHARDVVGLVLGLRLQRARLPMVKTVVDAFGIADHLAVAYLAQANVIDVLPVDTSRPTLRYYARDEPTSLGYLLFRIAEYACGNTFK